MHSNMKVTPSPAKAYQLTICSAVEGYLVPFLFRICVAIHGIIKCSFEREARADCVIIVFVTVIIIAVNNYCCCLL